MTDFTNNSNNIPQFMVAAPSSNSGKTTVTIALLNLLSRRGLDVRPFKCGPDYLDTQLHTMASGTQSLNLDLFMASEDHVTSLYARYISGKQAGVVEGVMGLFDGARRREASSADVARLLKIPVVLVIDARAVAYSVAPLLYGFKHFDPEVEVVGAIFNFVSSDSHYTFLKEACEDVGVHAFGYISKNQELAIKKRHLGLNTDPGDHWSHRFKALGDHVQKHIDIDLLLKVVSRPIPAADFSPSATGERSLKIAVAKDEAFNFSYHENLEVFKRFGEVTFFSPLHDESLPEADFMYLCGGYPELHLEALSANKQLLKALRNFWDGGGKVLAECGGLMYLGDRIEDRVGVEYPMTGVFPFKTSVKEAKLTLGYRNFLWDDVTCRGHEFHYSSIEGDASVTKEGVFYNARNQETTSRLYRSKNVYASYFHGYWGENDQLLRKVLLT